MWCFYRLNDVPDAHPAVIISIIIIFLTLGIKDPEGFGKN